MSLAHKLLDPMHISDPLAVPDVVPVGPDPALYATNGMVAGETIAQWTADWWTWALQTPAGHAPMMDMTGADANVDNGRAMYFIAGSFGGDATREFNVPADTPMLLPVINNVVIQQNGRGPDLATGGPAGVNHYFAEWKTSGVTDMFLKIDGRSIGDLQSDLIRSKWFDPGNVQPGSLIESFGYTGSLADARSIGYWAVLKGFAAGSTHTIEFGGAWDGGASSVHITDTVHAV